MTQKFYLGLSLAMVLTVGKLYAQETNPQPQQEEDLYEVSLEELMNIPINSASKKDETLFDAPLSSYTITRAEIDRAGSTSIMEALRLAPGVIVREQTNGVYDIHIRGFDNILRTSEVYTKSNLTTLVMIDNRPVFNHNLGGTFWEALPIDLNDVERIEIVRGPSAPLFGPNAVTGVINIITRKAGENKSLVTANIQQGSPATTIANLSAGKDFGKFSAIVSGNFQNRERFDEEYFLPKANKYFTLDELAAIPDIGADVKSNYPNPELALKKFGINAFLGYSVNEQIDFSLSAGTQQSETQKIFLSNIFNGGIPFTTNNTEASYVNLAAKVKNFSFRSSYSIGHDNLSVEATPNQYDFKVFDLNAEYTFQLGKLGTLVPGVSFQDAVYGDEDYKLDGLTFLNGTEQSIQTTSGFIRTDLKPTEAFRIIAAVRMDKFSTPDDAYFAYEFATTYKLNENNLIRAAITRSNSGSFIGNNYLNLVAPIPNTPFTLERVGSTNLKPVTVDMIELGYRVQLSKSLQFDIDIFHQKAKNFTALLTTEGMDVGQFVPTEQKFLNVPTTATQLGTSFSINFVPNDKLQIKPFITIQKTETDDLASIYVSSELADAYPGYFPLTFSNGEHKNTPAVYGGYFINYRITKAFNINLNGYYLGAQNQYDGDDVDGTQAGNIDGKLLFNAKASYSIKNINLFVSGRNIFNNDSREFFGADQIGGLYLVGASFNLN